MGRRLSGSAVTMVCLSVAGLGPRTIAGAPRCLLRVGHAVIRFEYRAAAAAELRGILPQARHDPVDIRNLIATEPPNVGRAGQLLFKGPPIFVGRSWRKAGDTEDGRDRQAQDYAVRVHARSFRGFANVTCSAKRNGSLTGLRINAAWEGSANSKQCEYAIPPSLHLADLLHRRDQARGIFSDEFGEFRRVEVSHRAARGLEGFCD